MKIFQSFVSVSLFFVLEGELVSSLPLHASALNGDPRVPYNSYVMSPHGSEYDSKISSPMDSLPVEFNSVPADRIRDQRRKTVAPGTYNQLSTEQIRYAEYYAKNGLPVPPASTIGSGNVFDFSETGQKQMITGPRGRSNTCNESEQICQVTPPFMPQDGKKRIIRPRKRSESFSSVPKNNLPDLRGTIQRSATTDDACGQSSHNESKMIDIEDNDSCSDSSQEETVQHNTNDAALSDDEHGRKRSNSTSESDCTKLKNSNDKPYRERCNTFLIAGGIQNRNSSVDDMDSSEIQNYNRERSSTIETEQRLVPYNPNQEIQYNHIAGNNSLYKTIENNKNFEESDDTKNNDIYDNVANNKMLQRRHQTYAPGNNTYVLRNEKRSNPQLHQNNQYINNNIMINHYIKSDGESKEEYKRSLQSIQSPRYDQSYPCDPSDQMTMLPNQSENQNYSHLKSPIEQIKMSRNQSVNRSYNNHMTNNEYLSKLKNQLLQDSAKWSNHSASVWECDKIKLKTGDLVCFAGKGCVSWGVRLGLRGYYNNPLGVSHVGIVLVANPNDMLDFIEECGDDKLDSIKHGNEKKDYMESCIKRAFTREERNTARLFLIHATGKYGVHIVPLRKYIKGYKGDVFVRRLKKDITGSFDDLVERISRNIVKEYNANFCHMNRAVNDHNTDRLDGSMFCSQLVGDLYKSIGLLQNDILAVNVTPAELTSRNGKDLLREHAESEKPLKKDDSGSCCNIM